MTTEMLLDTTHLQHLIDDFQRSIDGASSEAGEVMAQHFSKGEKIYKNQLTESIRVLRNLPLSSSVLADLGATVYDYMWNMRWVGWGNYEFCESLDLEVTREFPLAMQAYLSARLIDDAIDGHLDYKGKCDTVYHHLAKRLSEPQAASATVMVGNMLLMNALLELRKHGFEASALAISRLSNDVIPGAMIEPLVNDGYSFGLYSEIINRKSVAYDSILHHVYFRPLPPLDRIQWIEMMADFSEMAQWLNDLNDEKDDLARNQLNVLSTDQMNHHLISLKIGERIEQLWVKSEAFPLEVKQVWAKRLLDVATKLLRLIERHQKSAR